MDKHSSAEAACIRYVEAQREVKRLTEEIGKRFDACMGADKYNPDGTYPQDLVIKANPCLMSREAYKPGEEEGAYGMVRVFLSDGEIRELLSDCPHCLAAHDLIQQRKAARKAFGAAKRSIGAAGRAALAKARGDAVRDLDDFVECQACYGKGFNDVERQVAERKSDVQTFRETCDACEGTGKVSAGGAA